MRWKVSTILLLIALTVTACSPQDSRLFSTLVAPQTPHPPSGNGEPGAVPGQPPQGQPTVGEIPNPTTPPVEIIPELETPAAREPGSYDELVTALNDSGESAEPGEIFADPAMQKAAPRIKVNSRIIRLPDGKLRVFEFPDEATRRSVTDTFIQSGGDVNLLPQWARTSTIWARGRLIVLYSGLRPSILRQLTRLLGPPIAGPGATPIQPPQAVQLARQWLALQLSVPQEVVRLISYAQVTWPDGCLGLAEPDEICTEALIPGWQSFFQVNGQGYEVRSDQSAGQLRMRALQASPPPPTAYPPPAETPGGQSLVNTKWQLVSMGPAGAAEPVIPGSTLTLEFRQDGSLGGSSGCNSFSGSYQVLGNSLSIGALVSTLMACTDENLMQQEARYLAALQSAISYELQNNQLAIGYEAGQALLFFIFAP
jgi:heat shock protein HslJ